jgi:hypothetical protein
MTMRKIELRDSNVAVIAVDGVSSVCVCACVCVCAWVLKYQFIHRILQVVQ